MKLIKYLIYVFGVTSVDRAISGVSKAMNNLDKVIDRQQERADHLEAIARKAVIDAENAKEESLRAGRAKAKLGKLFE